MSLKDMVKGGFKRYGDIGNMSSGHWGNVGTSSGFDLSRLLCRREDLDLHVSRYQNQHSRSQNFSFSIPDLRFFRHEDLRYGPRLEDPCSLSPLEDPDLRRSPLTCGFTVVGEGDETKVVVEDVTAVDTPVEVVDCKA
ncbi:hypothetical protein L1987_74405 [Smallanthus sonchifolius]|uniref:Uncharacterized protein n=1 Tax=Smallanthus sonchifolius TaxID=185202 RepID=A0ACB9A3L7_9ASTR|nr:hypothetical protein L1987_74405 [Smallanthus sonchifolius]